MSRMYQTSYVTVKVHKRAYSQRIIADLSPERGPALRWPDHATYSVRDWTCMADIPPGCHSNMVRAPGRRWLILGALLAGPAVAGLTLRDHAPLVPPAQRVCGRSCSGHATPLCRRGARLSRSRRGYRPRPSHRQSPGIRPGLRPVDRTDADRRLPPLARVPQATATSNGTTGGRRPCRTAVAVTDVVRGCPTQGQRASIRGRSE